MSLFLLILAILGCEVVGLISGLFTASSIKSWYLHLKKPSFNPPNAIFGPIWVFLYALMGVSLYLVIVSPQEKTLAIFFFFVQLVLNFFWSFIFFVRHHLRLAFWEIVLLLLAIVMTMVTFWGISPVASFLLLPYLLWVSFAALLTHSIMRLNTK